MKNQVVFKCRKCGHQLFVEKINKTKLKNIMSLDCLNCGEEGCENWILVRIGNYEEEYGKPKF